MGRKKWLSAGIVPLSVLTVYSAQAKAENLMWHVDAGISYFAMDPDLPRDLVIHPPHPGDQSFMNGLPGSTQLDDIDMTFLNLEIVYTWPISREPGERWSWGVSYVLKIPVSDDGRNENQNKDYIRPSAQGSYIYTELSDVNLQHEVGFKVTYRQKLSGSQMHYSITPGLYLGYWQMTFEKGWNRFGQDEVERGSDADGFSVSPQIAVTFDISNLNFTAFTGYRSLSLDYDCDSMGSSSATGIEFGASVGWKF